MKKQIQPRILEPEELDSIKVNPRLEEQFAHLSEYGFIKRKIIEARYAKAIDKAMKEQYEKASIKDD